MRLFERHIGSWKSLRCVLVLVGVMGMMTKGIGQNIWAWEVNIYKGSYSFQVVDGSGNVLNSPSSQKPEEIRFVGSSLDPIPMGDASGSFDGFCWGGDINDENIGIDWEVYVKTQPFYSPSGLNLISCVDDNLVLTIMNDGYEGHKYSFSVSYESGPWKLISEKFMETSNPQHVFQFDLSESNLLEFFGEKNLESVLGNYQFKAEVTTCDPNNIINSNIWVTDLVERPPNELVKYIGRECPDHESIFYLQSDVNVIKRELFDFTVSSLVEIEEGIICNREIVTDPLGKKYCPAQVLYNEEIPIHNYRSRLHLPLEPGPYVFHLANKNGCMIDPLFFRVLPLPELSFTTKPNPPSCYGNDDGSIDVEITDGIPPYLYKGEVVDKKFTISGLSAGEYEVSTSDNCQESKTIEKVDDGSVFETTFLGFESPNCNDNGYIELGTTFTGENVQFSLLQEGKIVRDFQDNPIFNGLAPGSYKGLAKVDGTCLFESIQTETLEPVESVVVEVDNSDAICPEDLGSIDLLLQSSGDYFELEYLATVNETSFSGEIFIDDFEDNKYYIPIPPNNYHFQLENKCKDQIIYNSDLIIKGIDPIVIENETITEIECYEDVASIHLTFSGGTPITSSDKDYLVSLYNENNIIFFPTTEGERSEFFFENLGPGEYYSVVKDANDCEQSFEEDIIKIDPVSEIEIFEIKDTHFDTNQVKPDQDGKLMIRCHGETVNFNPELETDYRGGTGVLTTKLELKGVLVPFTNLSPGAYTFTVTDDNDCSDSRQFELQEPALMEGDFVPTTYSHGKHIKCVGENNGVIKVSISGGIPPYDYAINGEIQATDDPDGNWTFSGLTAESPQTSYTIVVTDYLGCEITQVVILEPPTKPILEYSIISEVIGEYEIPCKGESATIRFTGSGGDEINGYRLQINGEIVGLFDPDGIIEKEFLAGSYSVKILDDLDCDSDVFQLDLSEPDEQLSFTSVAIHPNCIGGVDGSISIEASGGVPSYEYSLDCISWRDDHLFPGLEAGEYEVFVKDNNECTTSETIVVLDNPNPLTITHTETKPPSCHHGTDGSITVQTTNYRLKEGNKLSYFISGGHYEDEVIEVVAEVDPLLEDHFMTFENLWDTKDPDFVTENYEIWVEDFYECGDLVDQYIGNLALIAPDPIRLSAEVKAPSCYNGENGWFVISAQGGVPPYEFSLDNLSFVPSNTSDNSKFNFSDLSAGDYTVYVRDANFKSDQPTCLAALDIHLPQGLDIDVIEHVQNISCVGGDDGAIEVDVETYYESSPFEYEEDRLGLDWFFGSNPLSEGNSLTNLSRGVYTLKMSYDQDSLVCREQEEIAMIGPNIPLSIASVKTYPTSCGEVNDGRAIVNFTGGWTDSTTYYNLNDEGWKPTLGSSIVINELSIGDHNLKIGQSVFNCQDEISFTIQKSKISIDTVFIQAPTCSDGSNGMVILKASNVVEPRFLIADSSYNSSSGTYSGLSNGKIYNMVVIDDTNTLCASDTISFSFPDCDDDTEDVVITGVPIIQPVTCETSGDGIAQVIATGGLPPYQYMLDGGTVPSGNLSNLSYGIHKIIVLDELGKKDSVEFFMEAETSLSISSIATTKVTCSGGCDGSAIIDIEGGSGSNEVRWEDDFIGHERRELCPGIYSFQVIDKGNEVCLLDGEVNISAFEPLAIEVIRLIKPTCPGGSNGKIGIRGLGGSGSYSYAWGDGSTESGLVIISAGFYEVTLTDNQLKCSVTEEIELSDIPTILVSDTILGIPSCRGSTDGSIELVLENAVSPLVQWDDGGMGIFRKNLSSGTYHFTITSSNSCQISGEIELPARDPLSVDVSKTDNQCYGLCQGTIDLSISGGLAPYYIEWGSGLKSPHLNRLCNGVYDYQVIDRLGCVVEGSVEIRSPDQLSIELISINDVSCRGQSDGSLEISASGGAGNYSYEWNTGDNTTSLKDLAPGTYDISISDENGCSAAATYTISQPQSLFLKYENIIDPSCDGGNDGQIEVLAAGGNSGYQYSWDNLSTASFIDELYEGDYQLTILDEKGCDYTKTFTLEAPLPLSLVNTRALDPICFDESSGLISIEVIGGTQPYSYSWGSGQTTSTIEDIPYGEYELTVTDNNGCVIASSFQLTNPEPLSIKGIEELVMLCEGGSVFISPEGDWDKYSWQGPSGFSSESHRIEASLQGEYMLSVQNEDGCEVSQSFSIEWSKSILNADFIRISEAVVNEPLIFVDLSLPVPDEVEWVIPESENVIVTSMDDQFIEVVFTETGAYELGLVAYYQSCIAELFKTIEIEAGTGESSSARVAEIDAIYTSVFPNPSQGNVEVIVNAQTKEQVSVRLLDMSRYELIKENLSGKLDYLLQWDLSEVPSGVYFLVVQAGDNVQQKRILLVR